MAGETVKCETVKSELIEGGEPSSERDGAVETLSLVTAEKESLFLALLIDSTDLHWVNKCWYFCSELTASWRCLYAVNHYHSHNTVQLLMYSSNIRLWHILPLAVSDLILLSRSRVSLLFSLSLWWAISSISSIILPAIILPTYSNSQDIL